MSGIKLKSARRPWADCDDGAASFADYGVVAGGDGSAGGMNNV